MLSSRLIFPLAPDDALDDDSGTPVDQPFSLPAFDDLYEGYVDFTWRSVRRLGVDEAAVDDVDDDKREVFVLAELEGMTAKEIADAIGSNASTVYSRLRAARLDFEKAADRYRRRDAWRMR